MPRKDYNKLIKSLLGMRLFFAFPLAGRREERTAHLSSLGVPLFFVQGTRDRLSPVSQMREVVEQLQAAVMHEVETGDHGFKVLKKSPMTFEETLDDLIARVVEWMMERV